MNHEELGKQWATLVAQANDLQKKAETEGDSAETEAEFGRIMSQAEATKEKYHRALRLAGMEAELKSSAGRVSRPSQIELPHRTKERYSLLKAINEAASGRGLTGLEKEVSDELALKYGTSPKGFYFPAQMETYGFDTTAGAGAVGTVTTPDYIDLLRNKMLVNTLGAKTMADLRGNVSIPKQTGGATAYWVAESGAPTESAQAVGQVPLTPKTVGAYTDISRKFLLQSSFDAETFVRNDLATVLALELDRAALNGSGSSNQPTGILQNSSVNSVAMGTNGAAPTLAKIIEMETAVAMDNADIGTLHYVFSAKGRGKLKGTEKASGYPQYVWEAGDIVNGYQAHATNQLPDNLTKGSSSGVCSAGVFGNFADLIIGLWGPLDILVDPYTGSTSGTVRVVALQDCDIQLRRPDSFAKCVDFLMA